MAAFSCVAVGNGVVAVYVTTCPIQGETLPLIADTVGEIFKALNINILGALTEQALKDRTEMVSFVNPYKIFTEIAVSLNPEALRWLINAFLP